MKYKFDSFIEIIEAMKHLEDYHDCEKCHGKIVFIGLDKLGNTTCGYCNQIVNYPKLSNKGFKLQQQKWLKDLNIKEN